MRCIKLNLYDFAGWIGVGVGGLVAYLRKIGFQC